MCEVLPEKRTWLVSVQSGEHARRPYDPHFNNFGKRGPPGAAHRAAVGGAVQHAGDDRRGAVHHAAAGDCGGGLQLSVWAWLLGAAIAVMDGLVWAELGAAFPQAGGSYAFSARDLWAGARGKLAEFSVCVAAEFFRAAVDCVGVHRAVEFSGVVLAGAGSAGVRWRRCLALHYANFAAAGACLLVTALLYRNLSSVTRLAWVLFAGVMAAMAGVITSGFAHAAAMGGWHMPASPGAVGGTGDWRAGAGYADCDVRLLGLLQHHVSGQRGKAAGEDDSAGDSAVGAVCVGVVCGDESFGAALDARCGDDMRARARLRACSWWRILRSRRSGSGPGTRWRRW